MVDLHKIFRFANVFGSVSGETTDNVDAIISGLWDGNPPTGSDILTNKDESPSSARNRVIQIAKSQVGNGAGDDWAKYLVDTVEYWPEEKIPWCGIFATWVLHKAGLTSQKWKYGAGISSILERTNNPKPGDILYIDQPYQHHGIITAIDGDTVYSVDGNSPGDIVDNRKRSIGEIDAFYSIGPLVGES